MPPILKRPSAWIPIALALAVLASMLVTLALSGPPVPQADEGVGAHLFQIWLVFEVFSIVFFALKWLPQHPKQAFFILAIQIIAVVAACVPVFMLRL